MGFFNQLVKLGLDVLETPIDIVKDVVTLGGSITGKETPYTIEKLKEIGKDYDKIKDSLDDK